MLVVLGVGLLATGLSALWYLSHHPKGTPFSPRYRDLIETYLAVVLASLLVFGASFIIVGVLAPFLN